MADQLQDIRESWIALLNADPALTALGIVFEDYPGGVVIEDLAAGDVEGYVMIGDEVPLEDGVVLAVQLVTTVVAGGATGKATFDLISAARKAITDLFRKHSDLDGLAGTGIYAGSTPSSDGSGRRVHSGRDFMFVLRLENPVGPVVDDY